MVDEEVAIEIRKLSIGEVSAMAALHLAAFPESALSRLGEGAVRRYYKWQFLGPHDSQVWGAYQGNRLAGFCLCGVFRGAMSGFLRKNRLYLVGQVLVRPWLLANPVFRGKLNLGGRLAAVSLQSASSRGGAGRSECPAKPFAILSICVDPTLQRGGVGRSLMKKVEVEALSLGFREMSLTVRAGNAKAIGFYGACGWAAVPAAQPDTISMRKQLT